MKRDMGRRLARLEAKLLKSPAKEVDQAWEFKFALMQVVAFHIGKLSEGGSIATAFARALGMTGPEFKHALEPGYDGPDFWPLTLEKLNDLVIARGARPIMENGSLILEGPGQGDDRRNGFDVLDELYQEIPEKYRP
jgi:hypothetical protein